MSFPRLLLLWHPWLRLLLKSPKTLLLPLALLPVQQPALLLLPWTLPRTRPAPPRTLPLLRLTLPKALQPLLLMLPKVLPPTLPRKLLMLLPQP